MKKILLVIGVICSIFLLVLGGCSMQGKSKKNTEQEELEKIAYSKEMKATLEEGLKKIDPQALTPEGKIKSYEIDKKKLKFNPMGGIIIRLIINDNPKLLIDYGIERDTETRKLVRTNSGKSPELRELIQEN